jgi:hypothetical protein
VSPASRADDRAAAAAALLAGGLVGQQVAGKAIRDSLFLSAFRVSSLPGMMMLSAFVSAAAALLFARAMGRRSPSGVMSLGLVSAAVLLLGEWWLALSYTRAAAVAVYLHLALFGPALVSGLWSLVNERFDPHAAKGIVGRIGAGGSVGAVAGGLMTWLAAGRTSVPAMLIGLAAVSVACLLGLRWLRPPAGERPPVAREDTESPATGLRALRELPYLRNLALLVGLASFTEIVIDYVFKAEAAGQLKGSLELIRFFGPFYTGLAGLALVVQGLFSRPSLERLGLAGTVALHPLATAAGSALALLEPGLGSALVARGSNGVLRDSLFRSGYELLYTPLPPHRKRATKAVIDVAADKVGAIAGAAVAMFLVAATPAGEQALLALALLGSLAALAVARWLHQGYVAALRESLRSGSVHVDLSDAIDLTTRTTLTESLDRQSVLAQIEALRGGTGRDSEGQARGIEADALIQAVADLRSSRPDRIRHAIRKARAGDPALVPHLLPLLARSEVLADVLRYLRGCVPKCTGQVLDALLDAESSPTVRRRVPRVLKSCPTQRAVDGLVQGLDDPVFQVRAECGLVLSHLKARGPELRIPGEAVFSRVVRELGSMEEGERTLEHAFTLLGLVLDREPLLISFRALRGEDRRLRGTALEYLENVLPDAVRQRLWTHIGPEAPRAAPARPRGEVESELLQSVSSVSRTRLGLKPPRRE